MGGGADYSHISRSLRSEEMGYATKSVQQTFKQRKLHTKMDPNGVKLRESRDSEAHPISLAIAIALDLTGSMGYIPGELVKDGLPEIVKLITEAGIPNPQLMFLGVGDHECDQSPLQVGQYETSDDLLDFWLTNVWLEGGGGPNGGESYSLAHYFAGYHTVLDCFEKRGQKGFLFTIGDEPNLKNYPGRDIDAIMGSQGTPSYTSKELVAKAQETYHVYHLHVSHGRSSSDAPSNWKELLGQRCITVNNYKEIPAIIAKIVGDYTSNDFKTVSSVKPTLSDNTKSDSSIML